MSVHHHIHIRQAPQYLSDCVSSASAASGKYHLRSTGSAVYALRRTRTTFGERGFFYSGPDAWNTLPSDLHDITDTSTFRKRLKSVLFDRAYHWLLLALLDMSYSGTLQISHWLNDWLIDWLIDLLIDLLIYWFIDCALIYLQCFDTVGWAAGRASGLWKLRWDAGVVICLGQSAYLQMAPLMPLPLSLSCFSKSRLVLPFWYRLTWVVLDKGC